ncbi:hypothetical protein IKG50_00935, partial [Candidatus Saccharibacteria bacterium]|nr:hypothetical protein [Candidatus Saccharibacteria bacterium]
LGTKDNLSATPTVIVNGKEVNFYSTTNVQKVIEDAIEDALNGKSGSKKTTDDDDDDDDWNWDDDDDDDGDDDWDYSGNDDDDDDWGRGY